MLVIVYLLFPLFEGLNMKLRYYKANQYYGTYATEQAQRVQAEHHYTDEDLEEKFSHKGEKTSKFLLFITLPFMATISWLLGFRKRRFYFDHFIFTTEMVSFFILFGFLILPLIVLLLNLVGVRIFNDEAWIVFTVFGGFGFFVGMAAKRFFQFGRLYSVVFAAVFAVVLAAFLELVYKFILFTIAIHLL
jgi:hypothetical protein